MSDGETPNSFLSKSVENITPSEEIIDTKKKIASPPLNVLFNPSQIIKRDIWEINIPVLLEMLVRLIDRSDRRDLRLCGVAALTSSMIHRLKVESIFRLEKLAMQKKMIDEIPLSMPVVELKPMEMPYRLEPTYPVSLEDLLGLLETILVRLDNPKQFRKQVDLHGFDAFDFDQYFIKMEQILQQREDMLLDIVNADGNILFSTFVSGMTSIEAARCFLALLYLAMKGKVEIRQVVDLGGTSHGEDIVVSRIDKKE